MRNFGKFTLIYLLIIECHTLDSDYDDSPETQLNQNIDDKYAHPYVVSGDDFEYYLEQGVRNGEISQEEMEDEIKNVKRPVVTARATADGMRQSLDKIKYLFYSSAHNGHINLGRRVPQNQKGWHAGKNVKIVIHGWTMKWTIAARSLRKRSNDDKTWDVELPITYSNLNYNVIFVNWKVLASTGIAYYDVAAKGAVIASEDVAEFIRDLKRKGLISSYSEVHIVGFSLGAHVAGMTGYHIKSDGGEKIGRVTGIDPAGPAFAYKYLSVSSKKIIDLAYAHVGKGDADFVDIVHCNQGKLHEGAYGSDQQSGHVDFIVNGGSLQPECNYLSNYKGCSHLRCPFYFISSIKNAMQACNKKSCQLLDAKCHMTKNNDDDDKEVNCIPFGDKCSNSSQGIYYHNS